MSRRDSRLSEDDYADSDDEFSGDREIHRNRYKAPHHNPQAFGAYASIKYDGSGSGSNNRGGQSNSEDRERQRPRRSQGGRRGKTVIYQNTYDSLHDNPQAFGRRAQIHMGTTTVAERYGSARASVQVPQAADYTVPQAETTNIHNRTGAATETIAHPALNQSPPASAAVLGADSSTSQQATPAPIVEQLNSIASSLQALAAVSLQSTISNEELSSVATLLQALAAGSSALQQANSAPIDGHPKSAAVSLQAPAAASSTLQKVAVSTPVNEQLNSAVPALAAAPEIGSSVAQPVTSTTLVDEQLNRISGVRAAASPHSPERSQGIITVIDSTSSVPVSGAPVITPQNATSSMPPLAGNGSLYLTNPIKNGHAPELEASPAPASNKSEKGKLSKWTMKYVKDRLLKPKDKPSHTGKGHVLTSDGSPPPYSSIP